jgi:hypothetical protein
VSVRLLNLIFLQVLGLVLLMGPTASSKDAELLVLRHEVAALEKSSSLLRWSVRHGSDIVTE